MVMGGEEHIHQEKKGRGKGEERRGKGEERGDEKWKEWGREEKD